MARNTKQPQRWAETLTLTPPLARRWLSEFTFAEQRQLSQATVDFYAQEMSAGRWDDSDFRLVHCGNRVLMTNGQHRLHAVVQSGVAIEANVIHKLVAYARDVERDFATHDWHKKRTITDMLAATGAPAQSGLSNCRFAAFAAALKPIIGGFSPSSFNSMHPLCRSVPIRKTAVEWWMPHGQRYFELVAGAEVPLSRHLMLQPVMAVGLVAIYSQPERAANFLSAVAANEGLRKGDPRRGLANYLLGSPSLSRRKAETARRVASYWNAFVRGKDLTTPRPVNVTEPIEIEGSLYDGKTHLTWDFATGDNK